MGQCLHKAPVEGRLVLVRSGGGETAPGCASSSSNVVRCYDYFSPRIQEMIERRSGGEYETEVDEEIEASKAHWSELSVNANQRCAEDDKVFFHNLKHGVGGRFFKEWSELGWELGEKLAEGAQGALKDRPDYIVKVFKAEAGSLEDLHKQWPPGMVEGIEQSDLGYFFPTTNVCSIAWGTGMVEAIEQLGLGLLLITSNICPIFHGILLEDGRFGFVMRRFRGDLRKMIDECMMLNGNKSVPFYKEKAFEIICDITEGMRELHKRGIVHRDLKASNVLMWAYDEETSLDDPLHGMLEFGFRVVVADFESSALTVGTTFWRAPEVLTAVKNRSFTPSVCTEKSDVYSFSMTCYEVLTGKVPFEGELSSDYNMVLGGNRPKLPSGIDSRIQSMLERCWQHEPSKRPSFEEIWDELVIIRR